MTIQLRDYEEFVISSIAAHFSGRWWPGENPPDAYLQVGTDIAAVEISTLTQHVRDRCGGSKPRLSEDSTTEWLVDILNKELQLSIPDGLLVILTLMSPILNARRVKTRLKETINKLAAQACECAIAEVILSNRIGVQLVANNGPSGKKIVGVFTNTNSSANILNNAWGILEERIVVKASKCRSLAFIGPKWLALLNNYALADNETYQQAFQLFSIDHPFEKILLISRDCSVAVLRL